jgi:hypothetical protein
LKPRELLSTTMALELSVSMSSAIVLARPSHGHDQEIRCPIITRTPSTPEASPFSRGV